MVVVLSPAASPTTGAAQGSRGLFQALGVIAGTSALSLRFMDEQRMLQDGTGPSHACALPCEEA